MLLRLFLGSVVGGTLLACSPAQPPSESADPVSQDLATRDTEFPVENRVVAITSAGARMNGLLFIAQGAGPHPTVILLHGLPGQGGNRDLAEAMRRAGWNVLTFQYRGAWGSEGAFSLAHVLDDAAAAVRFIRGPEGVAARSAPDSVVLIGHSMGGWAALVAAALDDSVQAVASIAGWNVGRFGRTLTDPVKFAAEVRDNERILLPLHGVTALALTQEEAAHAEEWDLVHFVPRLAQRPVLLVAGQRDTATPVAENHAPLVAAFEQIGAEGVSNVVLDADHAFTDRRIHLTRELLGWLERQRGAVATAAAVRR